jgi:hypothetical protein
MPRKSIGDRPMTDAERQARHRAARATGAPVIRMRRPVDHHGRARRWHDAVAQLLELQAQYATPSGWKRCRTICKTALPPMRCGKSAIST